MLLSHAYIPLPLSFRIDVLVKVTVETFQIWLWRLFTPAVLHMCENSTPHVEGRKERGREERGKGEGRGREETRGEDRKTFIQLW